MRYDEEHCLVFHGNGESCALYSKSKSAWLGDNITCRLRVQDGAISIAISGNGRGRGLRIRVENEFPDPKNELYSRSSAWRIHQEDFCYRMGAKNFPSEASKELYANLRTFHLSRTRPGGLRPMIVEGNVVSASYSSKLKDSQWFNLGYGDFKGRYVDESCRSWGNVGGGEFTARDAHNDSFHGVCVYMPDNKLVANKWPPGILSFRNDRGEEFKIYVPEFEDIEGDGFMTTNGTTFRHGYYISSDGSSYFDYDLTELAGKAEQNPTASAGSAGTER